MADLDDLTARIDRLSAQAAAASGDAQLLSEIEETLAEGYMQALNGDARSKRLGKQLERLVEQVEEPGVAVDIRRIALQRSTLDRRTASLRAQLSIMREHFTRLRAGHSARG